MVTASIGHDAYKTEIISSHHTLVADEPAGAGTDLGPSPQEFLLIALASCTAITLRMYANRKNMSVDKILVEVEADRTDTITTFLRKIFLTGSLTEDQRTQLLQIAERCPVHKTLTHPIEIKTELA